MRKRCVKMEENKLTDEEIVEILKKRIENINPWETNALEYHKGLLDLIHRLQKENKGIKKLISKTQLDLMFEQAKTIEQQKAEIERWKEEYSWLDCKCQAIQKQIKDLNKTLDLWQDDIHYLQCDKAELQKQVDELTDKLGKVLLGVKADELLVAKGVEQAVKDKAKEILQYVGDLYDDGDQRFRLKDYQWHKDLCKRNGVEVE